MRINKQTSVIARRVLFPTKQSPRKSGDCFRRVRPRNDGTKSFFIILAIGFILSACSPSLAPESAPSAAIAPTSTPLPCKIAAVQPTPLATVESLFAPVTSADWVSGPEDAAVTIIVYSDYQCTECKDDILRVLVQANSKEMRLVFRPYPQTALYDKSLLAAQAAEAAGAQDHYWEMHDLLFEKQALWVSLAPDDFIVWVTNEAKGLSLDKAQFEIDFTSEATVARVQAYIAAGAKTGMPVLPLVLINNEIYTGPPTYAAFEMVTKLTALGARQFDICPPFTINTNNQYIATIKTAQGDIVIELYADKAPLTVNSFIFLARNGWYDGVSFHRVIPDFVAQTGDPSGTGLGGPGYLFVNEINAALYFDKPGMVGMANSGPNTNGSQFFITFKAAPHLNGNFTVFGHVLSGMDVAAKLTTRDPSEGGILPTGDLIITITIEER